MIEGIHTGISVTEEEPSKVGAKKNNYPFMYILWTLHNNGVFTQVAHCKVDDGYPRPNITWYKDRFPLQQSDGGKYRTIK